MNDDNKRNLIELAVCSVVSLLLIVLFLMFAYGLASLFAGRIIRALICIGIPAWVVLTAFIWGER